MAMPRPKTDRRSVQVRFDPATAERLYELAKAEGWTWSHGGDQEPFPSRSEAVRRLVLEALEAREAGDRRVVIGEAGWEHAAGVETREMVRRMLSWAASEMPKS